MNASDRSPLTVTRIPDPGEPVPPLAWPTALLFVAGVGGTSAAILAGFAGALSPWVGVPLTAVCMYLAFTVSHDAAHHAASSHGGLNKWMGRISTPFFAPIGSFALWRFIHMQHHRFTNDRDGSDPDAYASDGPSWQRPLRWLTLDFNYLRFYTKHLRRRPAAEKRGFVVQLLVVVGGVGALVATGHTGELLLYIVLPQRIATVWLAFAFDYLPHHGLHLRPSEDKLKTTRNRIGGEWWLTPLLLYQNYHLVHHLHPVMPFFRYLAVWRRNEEAYLAGEPELSTVRGRPLTVEEYRELRRLAEHAD